MGPGPQAINRIVVMVTTEHKLKYTTEHKLKYCDELLLIMTARYSAAWTM